MNNLASKTSLTRKMWSKIYSKCMMSKPKAQLSKLYQNVYSIASKKNWVLFDQKCGKKNGSQMKNFQSIVNTLMRGHICSFLQVR